MGLIVKSPLKLQLWKWTEMGNLKIEVRGYLRRKMAADLVVVAYTTGRW